MGHLSEIKPSVMCLSQSAEYESPFPIESQRSEFEPPFTKSRFAKTNVRSVSYIVLALGN